MHTGEVLVKAADLILRRGLVAGTRRDEDGRVCALGAIDTVLGVLPEGPMDLMKEITPVVATVLKFKRILTEDAMIRAIKALSEAIPAGAITESDWHNFFVIQHQDPEKAIPGVRVAWYSNTHKQAEVVEWFLRAAANAGLHQEVEAFLKENADSPVLAGIK